MKDAMEKAGTLIEALPYIRNYKNSIIIIKFGGSLIDDIDITRFLEDVLFLSEMGIYPVLVHGGGPLINQMLKERDIESKFHNGLRITDDATYAVVKEVLVDRINRAICMAISNLGGMAKTISGYDSGCIAGVKLTADDGFDLGNVGEITTINTNMLNSIVENKVIPVISPIAADVHDPNQFYNVNADTAAAAVAAAIGAEKIVMISDTHGIKVNGELISSLTETRAKELISSGVIKGGMIPKTEACIAALRGGVRKAHIISGLNNHALLLEIFTDEGVGTEIFRDHGAQYSTADVREVFNQYVIQNYTRADIVPVRGNGSYLWDCEGKKYIDLFPGWAVNGLGHCHPKVVKAVKAQAENLLHVPNTFLIEPQGKLARLISEKSFGGKCFFCNSGAEAVETALKLARLNKGPDKYRIISMDNSFHGRTLGAISATGQPKYHKGFPIADGFDYVPFNDIEAVTNAVTDETAAIILEVIQGEGGVNIADKQYMQDLRALCDAKEMLLIIDEVQTGMGRTGEWFAYQHYGITPDIITLAKALGGGIAIGAICAAPDVAASLVPGTHASTFGGNPIATEAGIAVFEAIEDEDLIKKAIAIGDYIADQFRELAQEVDYIKNVRNKGVMIGIELKRPGQEIVAECMKRGVIMNCTHDTVLRVIPAMNITEAVFQEGFAVIKEVMLSV